MIDMYEAVKRAKQCYQLLRDELSQKIFKARLAIELEPSHQQIEQIVRLGEQQKWLDALDIPVILRTLKQNPKKLILYGTNVTGRALASFFLEKSIDFYGFCGRRAGEFPAGLMGKPVISPDYLFRHSDYFYVVIAVCEAVDEIKHILRKIISRKIKFWPVSDLMMRQITSTLTFPHCSAVELRLLTVVASIVAPPIFSPTSARASIQKYTPLNRIQFLILYVSKIY